MESLKTRLEQISRIYQQWENGILDADELRAKLAECGVTVSDEEYRAMTRDDA